jgi:exosortase
MGERPMSDLIEPWTYTLKRKLQMDIVKYSNKKNASFLIFSIAVFALFYTRLRDLLSSSLHSEYYSHIIFIPLISGYLLYTQREAILSKQKYSFKAGFAILLAAFMIYLIGRIYSAQLNTNDYLSLMTVSAITFWVGGFTLFYGTTALRVAAFPLLFLIFMIPIPTAAMERIIILLQTGSTEAAEGIFKLTGMPYARDGFVFNLPTMSIEVAKQCSGIRSSLALVITCALAANFFLRTAWTRALFLLSIIPIAILKNGIRIAVLSVLGVYVDERILASDLHRKGGVLFFILALFLLWGELWLLRKAEKKVSAKDVDLSERKLQG